MYDNATEAADDEFRVKKQVFYEKISRLQPHERETEKTLGIYMDFLKAYNKWMSVRMDAVEVMP